MATSNDAIIGEALDGTIECWNPAASASADAECDRMASAFEHEDLASLT